MNDALARTSDDHAALPALLRLAEAAETALERGDARGAALALHRRAALLQRAGQRPSHDLALAVQLLDDFPEEKALVLLDLGHALHHEGDLRRAALIWQESARLAKGHELYDLLAAARHALGKLADEVGAHQLARDSLRASGAALVLDIERDFLLTLGHVGALPADPRIAQERARRAAAVEAELAALKAELGVVNHEA